MQDSSMAVTIYDVARYAGVGIGTVSRAMNNSPRIKPETKARIQKAIRELKYRPHALARGLALQKTGLVAILLPVFTGYFYIELLKAIQQEISQHDYDLVLYSITRSDRTGPCLRRILEERRVDGVLVLSLQIPDAVVQLFRRSGLPVVLADGMHEKLDSFFVENEQGAFEAASYLIAMGHSRIGMIDARLSSPPAHSRLIGFRRALAAHHIQWDPGRLVISDTVSEKDGFNREAGYEAMKHLLALKNNRPTGVFISSDIQAAGAVQAVREAGLGIPDDMAIVGFDDIELAEYLGLTTMHQPLSEMGGMAVRRLIERIENPDLPVLRRGFDTRLVVRQSCGGNRTGASQSLNGARS
jgi:DNA-binding LacI/PurR family transcriptional regulator